MSEPTLTVEEIIKNWINADGVTIMGKTQTYKRIPNEDRRQHFLNLIKTFEDLGYDKDFIKTKSVTNKVIGLVWRKDKIINMTVSELRRAVDDEIERWEDAVREYFPMSVSRYIEEVKPEPIKKVQEVKQQKALELNPSDRITGNTAENSNTPPDLDFLAELGIFSESENE